MHILVGLAITLGAFALYVSTRPAAFRIERSRALDASAAELYALIQDFHAWARWSPWDKMDPGMERIYEGADSGVGAVYRWRGNNKVGEGAMRITGAEQDARVELDLEFIKPFPAKNRTVFTLEAAGEGTRVTWAMEGENGFVAKAFGVFMNMDAMVGKDFEKGLAAMGAAAAEGREAA